MADVQALGVVMNGQYESYEVIVVERTAKYFHLHARDEEEALAAFQSGEGELDDVLTEDVHIECHRTPNLSGLHGVSQETNKKEESNEHSENN